MASLTLAGLCSIPGAAGPDRLAQLQSTYDHESAPVHKAKDLAKLEPDQFASVRQQLSDGNEVEALGELEHFRDEVGATLAALHPLAAKAEGHPDGFKELQIALREALRQMDAIIVDLPTDKRPWFRAVRSDLQDDLNGLIDILFPRHPGKPHGNNPSS
ncbi:MAG: hypothetical protein ACLP1Y_15475 [Candidatus Acidiferrales bacterium]